MSGLIGDLSEVRRIGSEEVWVEWRIPDVLSLPAGSDVWYLSNDFRIGCDRFRLRLNPSWNPLCPAKSACLKLGLVKYQGGPRQTFHVIVDIRGGVEKRREGEKEFWEHDEYFWNDFCSWYELVEHGTSMMPAGVLTITCILRRSGVSGDVCSLRRHRSVEVAPTNKSQFHDHAGSNWTCLGGLSAGAAFDDERRQKNNENNNDEERSKNEMNMKNRNKVKKTKKIFLPAQHGSVINSLKVVLASGIRADLTLESPNREWSVHRAILEGRSSRFHTLGEVDHLRLDSDLAEAECALDSVLQFLYTGEVEHLTTDNVCGTYVVAQQFLLGDLKSICIQYMRDRMCPEMVCDALVLAKTYGETDLKGRALECYFRESVNVIETTGWKQLRENHPDIISELFKQLITREGKKRKNE